MRKSLAAFAFLIFAPFITEAQVGQAPVRAEFKVPTLTGPVVDGAGVMDPQTARQLDSALRQLKESGGSQINVLTVANLGGLEIEPASIQVVDQWKLGNKKISNGVLLILAQQERKVRIEVGQGLEGVLPDAIAKRIIDQQMSPLLRSGSESDAILVGVAAIVQTTDPNFDFASAVQTQVHRTSERRSRGISPLFILLIIVFFLIFGRRGGPRGPLFFGGFGGGGFGGGGFGGGGGSWGGGGGGFNGGGASGGW